MTPISAMLLAIIVVLSLVAAFLIWLSHRPYRRKEPNRTDTNVDAKTIYGQGLDDLYDLSEEQIRRMQAPPPFEFLSIVNFNLGDTPENQRKNYPLHEGRTYVFMGEIPSMPNHCVVFDYKSGQMYAGYSTDMFKIPSGG